MRIAILSLNPGHNYGGIIQSYALKTVLERMGHEVRVICYSRYIKELYPLFPLKFAYRFLKKVFVNKSIDLFLERSENKRKRTVYHNTWDFIDEYLNPLFISSFNEIKEKDFDAFVVGSDQVWRPKYFEYQFHTSINNAFLSFAKGWDVRRIAYAPSFGANNWEYSQAQTDSCSALLKEFDAISIREYKGASFCSQYFGVEAKVLADPTMLLSKEDYMKIVDENVPQSAGNLFVYALDNNPLIDKLVAKISTEKGLKPFSLNGEVKPSVESWICAFSDSKFIITDSFHACVFSILFHKPFAVVNNFNRGTARIESLLKYFKQGHRLVTCLDDYEEVLWDYSFDDVDVQLSVLRNDSNAFLNKALS